MGGLFGAIAASFSDASFDIAGIESTFPAVAEGRTLSEQGYYQLGALAVTLIISLAGGAFSGLIASYATGVEELFDDKEHWRECEYPEEVEINKEMQEVIQTDRTAERGKLDTLD